MIRPVTIEDAEQLADIYNYYIKNTIVTFEEELIDAREMSHRLRYIITKLPWLVCEEQDKILGYAYATGWKTRIAYRYSVESTIYMRHGEQGKGVGSNLYAELIGELRKQNIHAVMGGISLPNEASVRLHEKLGFHKVAEFQEVGYKFSKWINVGYWQLVL